MMMFLNLATAILLLLAPVTVDESLDSLFQQVKDPDRDTRIGALIQLSDQYEKLNDEQQKRVAKTFITTLSDRVSLVRTATKVQIEKHADSVNEFLGEYVQSDDPKKFSLGCEAMKSIGPPAAKWVDNVAAKLSRTERHFLLASLHALRALDGEALLPLLDRVIEKLDHKDFNVQLSACRVIVRIGHDAKKAGPKLLYLLENGNASARSWASVAMGAIGTHEEYDVVALLTERLSRFYLIDRERALMGIGFLGKEAKAALPKIEELMEAKQKSVQHRAAEAYWKITGDTELALQTLLPLIESLEHGVETMEILGSMGETAKSAVPQLIKQLSGAEDAYREAAVYALASIGPAAKSAIEPLKKMSDDHDLLIRQAAKWAIGKIEQPEKSAESSD